MIISKRFLHIIAGFREFIGRLAGAYYMSKASGDDFYINGADVLPPPLTAEEEARAISALSAQSEYAEAARKTLIEHNLRLVVYIARKFENTGVGIEDLISIGTIGLIKAVNTYNGDRNIKLATYASRCIENEILMHIRKNSSRRGEISIDEPLNIDWDGNELLLSDVLCCDENSVSVALEHDEDEKTLRRAVAQLSERERLIIELRYGLSGKRELTQKEVADLLGISQSYISRLEKKIISSLRDNIAAKI